MRIHKIFISRVLGVSIATVFPVYLGAAGAGRAARATQQTGRRNEEASSRRR